MIMKSELYVTNRNDWRNWLEKNHDAAKEVWLIYYKKHTGKPSISYEDTVEEALCFGWVDSILKRLDDDRCARKFTPRKSSSSWSESNRKRAEKMIREQRMTEAGMARIREARERGEWSRVREVRKELAVPSVIQEALAENEKARAFFETLANSYKRQIVGWVSSAKKEETRARRLTEVIGLLEKNQKLGLK
jgi:uncharacterized protein YdeI (YjbR/CyaY-like superfamily)